MEKEERINPNSRNIHHRYPKENNVFYQFKLKAMDQIMKSYVAELNYTISERLKSIGVQNNPFIVVYNKREVRYKIPSGKDDLIRIDEITNRQKMHGDPKSKMAYPTDTVNEIRSKYLDKDKDLKKSKLPLRTISDVYLDINHDFIDDYNNRKLDFFVWFNNKYPEQANKYYKKIIIGKEPDTKYELLKYKEEYFKDEPIPVNFNQTKVPYSSGGAIMIAGWKTEDANITGDKATRYIKTFTSKDVDNFLKGENDFFNDTHVQRRNVSRYLKSLPEDTSKEIISDVLKYALEEFRQRIINTDFEKLLKTHKPKTKRGIEPKGTAITNTPYQNFLAENRSAPMDWTKPNINVMSRKYQSQINKISKLKTSKYKKSIVNREVKFPNVDNIRRWFFSSGIYKSNLFKSVERINEFNKKTMKGKISAVNSAVFLIANGIYTMKTGEKTHFKSGKPLIRAGKKVSLGRAIALSKRNAYVTNRTKRNTYFDSVTARGIRGLRRVLRVNQVRDFNT